MPFDLARSISVLERTPDTLRSLLAGLSPDWTHNNEGPDTWSPFNIVGHLIDGEETDWVPRARIILQQSGEKTFTPFDRLRHLRVNQGRSLEELLDSLAGLRAQNVSILRGFKITEAQLDLTGVHPDFGEVTLRQLLATWVAHDLGHLAQIARVMAKQYRSEVGPWEKYLPVLHR
ncbi:MAG: DinB family protein [Gemmatimonadota bacterium]